MRRRPKRLSGPFAEGTGAFPWPVPRAGEFGEVVWDGLAYSAAPGHRPLFLDLRVPRGGPAPLVIWLHGGGWNRGSRRRDSPNLERHWMMGRTLLAGFAVALVDYRMIGETVFPGPVADVRAAIRWLRSNAGELGVDGSRVGLWGESAGAHLACIAVACDREIPLTPEAEDVDQDEDVQALVAWYGPVDLAKMPSGDGATADMEVLAGSEWDAAAASPLTYVRADLPPILVAHGRDDDVVPVEHGRAYSRALREAGADVEYVEADGGHVFDGADAMGEVIERTLDFLRRRLGAPESPAPARRGTVLTAAGDQAGAALRRTRGCRERGIDVAAIRLLAPAGEGLEEVEGLPPVLIGVGAEDPRLEESLALAARLRESDIPLRLRVFPGVGEDLSEGPAAARLESDLALLVAGASVWDDWRRAA